MSPVLLYARWVAGILLNSPESHNGGHKLEKIAEAIAKPLILKVKCGFSTDDSLYIKKAHMEINTTL